jgi:hypothetical protein
MFRPLYIRAIPEHDRVPHPPRWLSDGVWHLYRLLGMIFLVVVGLVSARRPGVSARLPFMGTNHCIDNLTGTDLSAGKST